MPKFVSSWNVEPAVVKALGIDRFEVSVSEIDKALSEWEEAKREHADQ